MTNHIHLIASTSAGFDLSDTLRDFKRHTSKSIIKAIREELESRREWLQMLMKRAASRHERNEHYQLRTHENHAIGLFGNSFISQKLDYIYSNPVRARFVDRPEDWLYSSATNYASEKGLINVSFLK
jgi:REP element-mobilizing transposase RayT